MNNCAPNMKRRGDAARRSLDLTDFYLNGFGSPQLGRGEANGDTSREAALEPCTNSGAATRQSAAVLLGKGDGAPAEDTQVLVKPKVSCSKCSLHWSLQEKERLAKEEKEQGARLEEQRLAKQKQQRLAKLEQKELNKLEEQRLWPANLCEQQPARLQQRELQANKDEQLQQQPANEEEKVQNLLTNKNEQQLANQEHQMTSPDKQMTSQELQMTSPDQQMTSPDQQMTSQDQQMASLDQQMANLDDRRLAKLDAGVRTEMQLLQGRAQVNVIYSI